MPEKPPTESPVWPIRLGCPVWNCHAWDGEVYPPKTPRRDWLRWYTSTFNTVEGNSTFYALPDEGTFHRWGEEAATGFHFCFKFPQSISHERELVGCGPLLRQFTARLQQLAQRDCLGPTFLQLGPRFAPSKFSDLESFLTQLPQEFPWAVELRNFDWFDRGDNEHRVNDLLNSLAIDKVLFDSRPLYQSAPDDPIEAKSQQRKPRTPVRQTVTGGRPMLRIVGRNRGELAETYFRQWAPIVHRWVANGLQPYVFCHSPDDALAPSLCRRFADCLNSCGGAQPVDHFDTIAVPTPPHADRQLSLLDFDEKQG